MKKEQNQSYEPPKIEIVELEVEGVFASSNHTGNSLGNMTNDESGW